MLQTRFLSISKKSLFLLAFAVSLSFFAACSLKKPTEVTPVPSEQVFEKSFFVNEDGSLRKFLFGVAAESIVGQCSPGTPTFNYNRASHSNIVFDPFASEGFLIGRELNPSRMGGSGHLKAEDLKFLREVIRIKITKRFYSEKARDGRGRETMELIENDSRSHWSARPNLKLDLSSIEILDRKYAMFGYTSPTYSIGSISEIEKNKAGDKKYLGYSVMADAKNRSSCAQAQFRINFLEYQSKTSSEFKAVPYNERNSQYINTLHVIGKLTNGTTQILNAAHWDVGKEPIKIRLNNFPDEYLQIGIDVINEWNIAFTQALNPEIEKPRQNYKKFFVAEASENSHSFDLRYPTVTWVADKEISAYGPLGVGMAHADVTNGEILWGGVTIYGGMIESYVRRSIPNETALTGSEGMSLPNMRIPISKKTLDEMNLSIFHKNYVEKKLPALTRAQDTAIDFFKETLEKSEFEAKKNYYEMVANKIGLEANNEINDFVAQSQRDASGRSFTKILGIPFQAAENSEGSDDSTLDSDIKDKIFGKNVHQQLDSDLRMVDKADGWKSAIQMNDRNYSDALRSIVKYLLLHEVGHMLGHGHQFKENIVPEPGTVPDKYIYGDDQAELKIHQDGLQKRATKEAHFTNYSSVMGYLDARSEVMIDYEDFVVGPHDILLTRYLYKGEYPTFKKGEADFKFEKVGPNGEIPSHSPDNAEYKTAFFPACNDLDVILSGDPFCDRFVQGSEPEDIRKSYVRRLYDGLASRLISFKPGGEGNAQWSESRLWSLSLNTMSRLRMFYDYMRQEYDSELKDIASNEDNLYRFEDSCTGAGPSNGTLDALFEKHPKLKKLCQTNASILSDIKTFVGINAVDHTRYNREERYSPSGMIGGDIRSRDFSQYAGSWVELSAYPIKLAALYNLTTTSPYVPTWFGLMPLERYSDAYSHYSMASFYPLSYSGILTNALTKNLQFSNGNDGVRTKVGRLVFSIGFFDYLNRNTNDSLFMPDTIDNRLEKQTNVDISTGMIQLKEHTKDQKASRVTHFSAKILDFQSKEVEDLKGGIYVLPDKKFIAKAPEGTFLLPLTEIRFFGQDANDDGLAYSIVAKITYDPSDDGKYPTLRALNELYRKSRDLYLQCVSGTNDENNGLEHFFNTSFEGFKYSGNIGGQPTHQDKFFESVETSFTQYYSEAHWGKVGKSAPSPETCSEAVTGMGVAASAAAALNMMFLRPLYRRAEVDQ